MGVVYLARDLAGKGWVALKVLPPEFVIDRDRLERFQREAEVVSRLDHEAIIPVYGVGEEDGIHFIAMKFCEGEPLDDLIESRREMVRLPPAEEDADTQVIPRRRRQRARRRQQRAPDPAASDPGWIHRCLRICEEVARALHHAHGRGVIHRDVKPGNIILDGEGDPWLVDFGLVRDLNAHTLTESRDIIGTVFYMAPETITQRREEVDHRVDIYALAVTLYELVTLERPFDDPSPQKLFHKIVNEEALPARRLNARLPRELETVLTKGMEKDPSDRYETALEFAEDLRRVRSFEPVRARPPGRWRRLMRWVQRHPVPAAAMVLSLLSVVGMIEYTLYQHLKEVRRRDDKLVFAERAYEEGDRLGALRGYCGYLALGGDSDRVQGRLEALIDALDAKDESAEAEPDTPPGE
jgi:serine/threonine protein kinase